MLALALPHQFLRARLGFAVLGAANCNSAPRLHGVSGSRRAAGCTASPKVCPAAPPRGESLGRGPGTCAEQGRDSRGLISSFHGTDNV